MKSLISFLPTLALLFITGCEQKLENSWQAKPYINAFGEESGTALVIDGERLSAGIESTQVMFFLFDDLISGGYKQAFTFSINGVVSGDEIEVELPNLETFAFDLYDGMIFNVDYESNDISRFIELMNNEYLLIRHGENEFTINTADFLELYKINFLESNS